MSNPKPLPAFSKERVSTGIHDLDIILEGGYREGSQVMFSGPSGDGKNIFASMFMRASIRNKRKVAYILSDMSSEDLFSRWSDYRIKYERHIEDGLLTVIDCYSTEGRKGEGIIQLQSPSSLNDLSIEIRKFIDSGGKSVVFHSLSTFALYNRMDSLMRFLKFSGERMRSAKTTTLYLVESDVHEKSVLAILEQGMDEIYSISMDPKGRLFLSSSRLPAPVPIVVRRGGVEIL